MSSYMVVIKNGAKDQKAIVDDLRRKIAGITTAQVTATEDTISLSKETTWAKLAGTVNSVKNGNDLEVYFNGTSSWTATAWILACLLFLLTIIGPVLPWYLHSKDTTDFENGVKQVLTVVSNK